MRATVVFVACVMAAAVARSECRVFPTDLNVKDFGAVGDGVHDDTAAIQSAADACCRHSSANRRIIGILNNKSITGDGPMRRIVFPEGVYLVTKPVFFHRDHQLYGLGKVVVKALNPDEDVFVFAGTLRHFVSGLVMDGGRRQMVVETLNTESANFKVRDCVFRNSSGTAIESISYCVMGGEDGKKKVPVGTYRRDKDSGEWRRDPRHESPERKRHNNSTLLTIERCRFVNCRMAADFAADGAVMREIGVVTSVTTGAVFRVGGVLHAYDAKVAVQRVGSAPLCVFDVPGGTRFLLDRSRFRTLDGTGVCLVNAATKASYTGSSIIVRDIETECGGSPEGAVVNLRDCAVPEILVVTRVSERSGRRVKAVRFDSALDAERLKANRYFRHMPEIETYSFAVGGNGPDVDDALPDWCAPYCEPVAELGAAHEVVKTPVRPEDGEVFWGPDHGVGEKLSGDDTAAMKALFAKAAAYPRATVVLPPRWIRLSDAIDVAGSVTVTAAGVAAIEAKDPEKDVFRVADGTKATFEHLLLQGGRDQVVFKGEPKRGVWIAMDATFTYDAHGAAIHVESSANPGRVKVVVDGGVHSHPRWYDGNADAVFNAAWFRWLPPVPLDAPMSGAVSLVNRGKMLFQDILGVPLVMYRYKHGHQNVCPQGDYRWIDNAGGSLRSIGTRFGGEWGGLCPVFNSKGGDVLVEGGCAWFWAKPSPPAMVVSDSVDDARIKAFGVICAAERMYCKTIDFKWRAKKGDAFEPLREQRIFCSRFRKNENAR